MSTSDEEWEEFVELVCLNHRPHAGYFTYEKNSDVEEHGVLQALDESLRHNGEHLWKSFSSRGAGNDPPDCEAEGLDGDRIAIEVTELVDSDSAAAARIGKPISWKPWESPKLILELEKRIQRKDNPTEVHGGPYDQYFLLIYCDEPRVLDYDLIEAVRTHRFSKTKLITRIFFLMSYSPWEGYCPYLELKKIA